MGRGIRMRWARGAIGPMALLLALGGQADSLVIDRIVAVVNKEIITLSEVQEFGKEELRSLQEKFQGRRLQEEMEAVERKYLDQLVIRSLQLQRARELNMTVTERDIELAIQDVKERNHLTQAALEALLQREGLSMEDYRKKISEEILIRKATTMEVRSRIEVTTQEVEANYQARLSEFMPPEELRASHILVAAPRDGDQAKDLEARRQAEALLKRAEAGEDFSELARRYSEDGSGARGGDLGLIRRGEILPDFEKALFALQPGEVGPLVRTPAGYHILKLTERPSRKARPLKEVDEQIRDRVYAEKAEARYQRWLEELKKKAYIEVSM